MRILDIPERIMIYNKWQSGGRRSISGVVGCSCLGCPDCNAHIEVEYDPKYDDVSLTFYQDLQWRPKYYPEDPTWFEKHIEPLAHYWERFKAVLRLAITGYVEVSGGIILQDEEHIDTLIKFLTEAKEFCKKKEYPQLKIFQD